MPRPRTTEHRIRGISRGAFLLGAAGATALGAYLARTLVVAPPDGAALLAFAMATTSIVFLFAAFFVLAAVLAPNAVVRVGPGSVEMTNLFRTTIVVPWSEVRAVMRVHRRTTHGERFVGWSLLRDGGKQTMIPETFAGAGPAIEAHARAHGFAIRTQHV